MDSKDFFYAPIDLSGREDPFETMPDGTRERKYLWRHKVFGWTEGDRRPLAAEDIAFLTEMLCVISAGWVPRDFLRYEKELEDYGSYSGVILFFLRTSGVFFYMGGSCMSADALGIDAAHREALVRLGLYDPYFDAVASLPEDLWSSFSTHDNEGEQGRWEFGDNHYLRAPVSSYFPWTVLLALRTLSWDTSRFGLYASDLGHGRPYAVQCIPMAFGDDGWTASVTGEDRDEVYERVLENKLESNSTLPCALGDLSTAPGWNPADRSGIRRDALRFAFDSLTSGDVQVPWLIGFGRSAAGYEGVCAGPGGFRVNIVPRYKTLVKETWTTEGEGEGELTVHTCDYEIVSGDGDTTTFDPGRRVFYAGSAMTLRDLYCSYRYDYTHSVTKFDRHGQIVFDECTGWTRHPESDVTWSGTLVQTYSWKSVNDGHGEYDEPSGRLLSPLLASPSGSLVGSYATESSELKVVYDPSAPKEGDPGGWYPAGEKKTLWAVEGLRGVVTRHEVVKDGTLLRVDIDVDVTEALTAFFGTGYIGKAGGLVRGTVRVADCALHVGGDGDDDSHSYAGPYFTIRLKGTL